MVVTDDAVPPALPPDFALLAKQYSRTGAGGDTDVAIQSPASIDSFSKMLARTTSNTVTGSQLAPPAAVSAAQPTQASEVHQHIQEMATKRISTLDYLRKAYISPPPPFPLPSHIKLTTPPATKVESTGSTPSSSTNPTYPASPTSTPGAYPAARQTTSSSGYPSQP